MSWNYRIIRRSGDHPRPGTLNEFDHWETFGIHEVHYHPDGVTPKSWTTEPVAVDADNKDGLKWIMSKMKFALSEPILEFHNGTPVETTHAKRNRKRIKARTRKNSKR